MMSSEIEALLKPSLSGSRPSRAMYSTTSHVVVSFFGGPIALLIYSMVSIIHARLLSRWWPFYIALTMLVIASQFTLVWAYTNGFPSWIPLETGNSSNFKLLNRIMALSLMGILYLLQRQLFTLSQMNKETPSPWVPGILACLLGFGSTIALVTGAISDEF